MNTRQSRVIVATSDLTLARLVDERLAVSDLAWCGSLSAALARLTPATELLIVDAALDAPMARLLATLFVDRRPDRRAIVVEVPGQGQPREIAEGVAVVARASAPSTLAALLDDVVDLSAEDLYATVELDSVTFAS